MAEHLLYHVYLGERTQGCDSVCDVPILQQPRPGSAAPQPLHRTTQLASLTSLKAVGVRLTAKPSPYQLLSGDDYPSGFGRN
jgi:hypothetical protein